MKSKCCFIAILINSFLCINCSRQLPEMFSLDVQPKVELLSTYSKVVRILDRQFVKTGQFIDMRYSWKVGEHQDFAGKDYFISVHFVNDRGELLWQDDHEPPTPTSQWKPGEDLNYSRVMKIPETVSYPQVSMRVGFYEKGDSTHRIYLRQGEEIVHKVRVLKMFVQPQDAELFGKGWGNLEFSRDGLNHWRWISRNAIYSFRNPNAYRFLTIRGGTIWRCFDEPQTVTVALNGTVLEKITLDEKPFERIFPISQALLGDQEWSELHIEVDKTFSPLDCGLSDDPRELAIMIYDIGVSVTNFREGWYPRERTETGSWRWCRQEGSILTGNPNEACTILLLAGTNADNFPTPPTLSILVNGIELEKLTMASDSFMVKVDVPADATGKEDTMTITLRSSASFNPAELGKSTDDREVAFFVRDLHIIPVSEMPSASS